MADVKTKPSKESVTSFINAIEDPDRRRDCRALMKIMKEVTGTRPKMWGPSIVGYGQYHFKYTSGREGDWFLAGFSPRKTSLTLYIMSGFRQHDTLMKKLGKHSTGKSCLYIKKLEDVDTGVLKKIIKGSADYVAKNSTGDYS